MCLEDNPGSRIGRRCVFMPNPKFVLAGLLGWLARLQRSVFVEREVPAQKPARKIRLCRQARLGGSGVLFADGNQHQTATGDAINSFAGLAQPSCRLAVCA